MVAFRTLSLASIDDYLGPGATRFFARGYQRATYHVHQVEVTSEEARREVTAKADLSYPSDWSTKGGSGELRPHLSTVDAFVLAVQLAELELSHAHGFDPRQRRSMRLRRVSLRAGNSPQEDLSGIELSARHVPATAQPLDGLNPPGPLPRSRYDCVVGSLRVRCDIEHPPPGPPHPAVGTTRYRALEEALGPAADRFYGCGFTRRRHAIEDLRADLDAWTAHALARFWDAPGAPVASEGLDGAVQPALSLVDCFVVNLQLAQVLMYELDSIRRSESNTLWMMQTVLELPADPVPLAADKTAAAMVSLRGTRRMTLRGAPWRTVDLQGLLGDLQLRSSFAHQLPHRAAVASA